MQEILEDQNRPKIGVNILSACFANTFDLLILLCILLPLTCLNTYYVFGNLSLSLSISLFCLGKFIKDVATKTTALT